MTSNQTGKRKYIAEGTLLVVTLIWGSTFVIMKESLNDISSVLFITLRYSVAALLLVPFYLKRRKQISKKLILGGMLVGLFLFLGSATQTAGLKFTTASRSAFITGTMVVLVPILQLIIEKRPPTKGAIAGVILVFLGLTFLSSGGNSIFDLVAELGSNFNFGDFLSVLCAFFFASQVVTLDVVSRKFDFWMLTFVQLSTVAILGIISTLLFDLSSLEKIKYISSNYLWFGILYTAIFATFINITLQTKFQKELSPTKAGIIYSFEPVFAAMFAYFLLNEKITNFGFVGGALIFLGLLSSDVYDSMKVIYEQRFKKS